ncbi:MAG: sensor histidine kinase [Lachnospiraceae bacterium]|jgi:hypothetical protein
MRTFGYSPPEYQLVLQIVFFTAAFLYFLLSIYGIIWGLKKKDIIENFILFVLFFFFSTCFCVRYKIFYSSQNPFVFFEMDYRILLCIGVIGLLFAVWQIIGICRKEKYGLRGNVIQESLDNLPSAIGFFDEQGMPKLINRKMYQICREMTGRDIQSVSELRTALAQPLTDRVFYDTDFQVYCFTDGSVWKFSEDRIVTAAGESFCQFLASEVSALYRSKQFLEEENRKLHKMSVMMKELSQNAVRLTREEETLLMKMRVHDNLGYSILASQRMLMRGAEEEKEAFLSQWNGILDLLNKDNETAKEEVYHQIQERAQALGVKIFYLGEFAKEQRFSELMESILLEALSNSVRHGEATELYVKLSCESQEWVMVITNNGRRPEKEITEGGGLSGLRKKVEHCHGTFQVCSCPEFSLTVKLPKKEETI